MSHLVPVVLLQAGKGADMGAVFGGASTTIFGSSGAGNILTRLTTGAAIVFMITSLTLTYGTTRQQSSTIMPEAAVAPADVGGDAAAPAGGDTDTAAADGTVDQAAPVADQAAAPAAADEAAAPAPAPAQPPAEPAAP